MLLMLSATIAGVGDFGETVLWGEEHPGLKNRRKRGGWNVGFLETVIRQTA